ncbi:ABC transporter substrate-binding protein [Elioraea sp. Yellowstone]|jgi:NitT/TauT family transport system substrate-binding protein|uniref:ABC transporter substrate-binding protein n=1 Tax=Elioraea sp. Yellowstone TaxID=2592070 RepID=UPI00114EF72B|nr:ABC transporter substrate-binding protein [Elioraea sp. Yellowstone]TQF82783.1 ABC transporter substrate-binding protein [Elioraea sp. Yellowstone]
MTVTIGRRGLLAGTAAATVLAPAAQASGEQISVTHWGVLMYGAPYAVAMEKGFFREAGVNITGILTSKGGGTTVRNVLAGGLPYGEVSLAAAVAAAREGLDIRIVNAGAATVADILWVTTPDNPVKTIKDLEGRKIAFTSPKSVTEMLVIMSLTASGIDLNKVERISTGGIGAGLTALRQGGVAAAPIMDPIWAREQGRWRPVFFVKDILPKMTQTVGITTTQFAREQPQKLRAIIAGRRKGVDFTYANPEEAGRIFAEAYELPRELGVRAVKNMVEVGYWSRGEIDTRALDAMVEGLRIIGEVEGPVDWSRLVDRSFLPPDLQATG